MTLIEKISVDVKLFGNTVNYDNVEKCGADNGTFYVKCEDGSMFWHNQRDWVFARSQKRWEDSDA